MNCLDFRRDYLADPYHLTAAREQHLQDCAACTRFARRQRAWDAQLAAAMRVPVPEGLGANVVFHRSMRNRRRRRGALVALAASLVLAVTALVTIAPWQTSGGMRAPEFIHHMHADPLAMKPPMPDANAMLAQVSGDLNIRPVSGLAARITQVKLCKVDGHMGAHLVLEHHGMRATAFVMPGVQAHKAGLVRIDGMDGELIQTDHGMIAVFCTDRGMSKKMANNLRQALGWNAV